MVMTRWSTKDLTQKLLNAQSNENGDQWDVIEFPAVLPNGKPVWPEYWKLEDLESVKAATGIAKWNACLLYTSPSPRDKRQSRMPSSA